MSVDDTAPVLAAGGGPLSRVDRSLVASLVVAAVVAAGVVVGARVGAAALLGAVAGVQALLAITWVSATATPGRWGALVLAAGTAVAGDICVSVWPNGRLGVLVAVVALAIPAMFLHQLSRGVARVRLVSSMSAIAVLLFGVISLPALVALRHEFVDGAQGGRVVAAAALAVGAALVVGYLIDLLAPVPRIDPGVARGVVALAGSALAGALAGYLLLRGSDGYPDGRGLFAGLVLGAAAGLLALVAAFVLADADRPAARSARWCRPVLAAVLPLSVLAPLIFLVCLGLRA